jgi:hypothetical protein
MVVTQQLREGVCAVELHLDPDRKGQPFLVPPTLRVLRGAPNRMPVGETVQLQWQDADTVATSILLRGDEVVLPTLLLPGEPPHALAPACLPYSPEFRRIDPAKGRKALTRLAALTGGGECLDLSKVWEQLPRHPREIPLAPWFYSLALLCFLLGILQRRTGLLASFSFRLRRRTTAPTPRRHWLPRFRLPRWQRHRRPTAKSAVAEPEATPPPTPPKPPSVEADESTLDAMRAARRRANRRTRRD